MFFSVPGENFIRADTSRVITRRNDDAYRFVKVPEDERETLKGYATRYGGESSFALVHRMDKLMWERLTEWGGWRGEPGIQQRTYVRFLEWPEQGKHEVEAAKYFFGAMVRS